MSPVLFPPGRDAASFAPSPPQGERGGWCLPRLRAAGLAALLALPLLLGSAAAALCGESLRARVLEVVDGDTLLVETEAGKREKVRYLLIDTPELHHPRRGREELGEVAAEMNRRWVEDREVRLETDREERDRYGRLLAYVWVRDSEREWMAGERLMREGLALPLMIPPNDRYRDRMGQALAEAAREERGLWGLATKRRYTPPSAWAELPTLRGHFITLKIRVTRVEETRRTFRLLQGKTPFRVVIYREGSELGDPKRFQGRTLWIVGKVTAGFDAGELILSAPVQIRRIL